MDPMGFGILQVCQKNSNDPICGGQLRTGPGKLGSMLQSYMWNLGNRTIAKCGKECGYTDPMTLRKECQKSNATIIYNMFVF